MKITSVRVKKETKSCFGCEDPVATENVYVEIDYTAKTLEDFAKRLSERDGVVDLVTEFDEDGTSHRKQSVFLRFCRTD